MEQLKVKKKEIIIYNVIIFLGLSFLFVYLQHAYRHHISPFSLVYLKKSIGLFWYVAVPALISIGLIWKHHRFALAAYTTSIVLVGFKVVEGTFIEFNKIIIVALFFYTVIAYFLYQLYSYYSSLACLNTNYSSSDLFEPLLRKINCKLLFENEEIEGHLTNWDQEGCFIKLNKKWNHNSLKSVSIFFEDREFVEEGEVVAETLDFTGIGIKFYQKPKDLNVFNWSEFNELIHELGFKPERLR